MEVKFYKVIVSIGESEELRTIQELTVEKVVDNAGHISLLLDYDESTFSEAIPSIELDEIGEESALNLHITKLVRLYCIHYQATDFFTVQSIEEIDDLTNAQLSEVMLAKYEDMLSKGGWGFDVGGAIRHVSDNTAVEKDNQYKGLVEEADDVLRLCYNTILGVTGLDSEEDFIAARKKHDSSLVKRIEKVRKMFKVKIENVKS